MPSRALTASAPKAACRHAVAASVHGALQGTLNLVLACRCFASSGGQSHRSHLAWPSRTRHDPEKRVRAALIQSAVGGSVWQHLRLTKPSVRAHRTENPRGGSSIDLNRHWSTLVIRAVSPRPPFNPLAPPTRLVRKPRINYPSRKRVLMKATKTAVSAQPIQGDSP